MRFARVNSSRNYEFVGIAYSNLYNYDEYSKKKHEDEMKNCQNAQTFANSVKLVR